ncbi:MAG: sugar ABC transporter permease [Defluviitaleaceae bacterium]|nr:sugar ABC transporter permease [Defluviitaleaceae bacterium]
MKHKSGKHSPIFYAFLFPALFSFAFVIVIPFFLGIYYSFTDWTAMTGTNVNWVGFANYTAVFNDVTFLHSFLVTVAFAVINIVVVNVVAFGFALLVTSKLKLKNMYRAAFFMPNLIGGIILGYIWQFIFNNAITAFGASIGSEFLATSLLANRFWALLAIVVVVTWQNAGYIMMIYVAAIQSAPAALLEAAHIDGANYWQRLRHILVPLVAPAFTVSLFLTLVRSFQQFDVNMALTAGGPSGMFMDRALPTTEFLALNIFNTAFAFRELAQGQAKSVIFFITLTVIALVQVYFNKRKEIEM